LQEKGRDMTQNKIIKPNEDLRGAALVECAVPKMQSPNLIEGATLYRCYLESQNTPSSVANVYSTTFKNLPKGFSIYLSPFCNTDGASFDPNIEWSTDEDGFRLGVVK